MVVQYLKGILAGLAAAGVVAAAMGLYAQGVQYRAAMSMTPGDSGFVQFHWHPGVVVTILTVVFGAGFWWQSRK